MEQQKRPQDATNRRDDGWRARAEAPREAAAPSRGQERLIDCTARPHGQPRGEALGTRQAARRGEG